MPIGEQVMKHRLAILTLLWGVALWSVGPARGETTWWAFEPVRRPDVPTAQGNTIRNPIDAFIQAKLTERGLSPAPPADPRALVRRMYFDLIGLPPTPEEVSRFVAAAAKDYDSAVAQLADELLASPHYGERWGRHWLDIAHYADTHGFERDMRRDNAWRYRDYVIKSLNDDKPYDRFLIEQIAGDVADPSDPAQQPTPESIIATGFLAAGPFDFVGQVETASPTLRTQARGDDLDDMVTQVISSTVGLTVNCARCHDHKLDPITMDDYYGLWAVFAGVKRGDRDVPATDGAERQRASLEAAMAKVTTELNELEGRGLDLADIVGGGDGTGNGKKGAGIDPRNGQPSTGKTQFIDVKGNTFVKSSVPFVDGIAVPAQRGEVVISSTGVKLNDLPTTSGKTWDYTQNGPVLSQDTTKIGGLDFAADDHSLIGLHANRLITFDLDAIRAKHGKDGSHAHMRFTATVGYGGRAGNGALFGAYVDGKPVVALTTVKTNDAGVTVDVNIEPAQRFLTLVALDNGGDISYDQVFLGDPRLRRAANSALSLAQLARLKELQAQRETILESLKKLPPPAPTTKVYAVVPQNAPIVHVLQRGSHETPGREVTPSAIRCVKGLSADLGDNKTSEGARRLALARWITDPANPLTRRVIANRLWHYHFGTGIVATPSDFGAAGDRPTHPELLDWLADELLSKRWSLKAMHKLIVTSYTYRQDSAVSVKAAQVDADNRLLWRMSPRRLEVEAMRDAVLSVAGTLNAQAGGPGFEDFTYQQEYAPVYRYVTADKPVLWRRTVYRYVVRTTQNEFMRVLDCADPSILTPVRNRTTTAIQALALMNNRFMIEQADHFAARLRTEAGDDVSAQIARGFNLAFGRPPADDELSAARALVEQHGLPAFCRMLFNANEFVYVD